MPGNVFSFDLESLQFIVTAAVGQSFTFSPMGRTRCTKGTSPGADEGIIQTPRPLFPRVSIRPLSPRGLEEVDVGLETDGGRRVESTQVSILLLQR